MSKSGHSFRGLYEIIHTLRPDDELLTLLHSEQPKLYRVLAVLSARGLKHLAIGFKHLAIGLKHLAIGFKHLAI